MITKAVITKGSVKNGVLRAFLKRAYETKETAVLYVEHGSTFGEYRRATEVVRRFLFLAGEFENPTGLCTVHSSRWLVDEGRRESWLRAQPINAQLGRARKALIIDGEELLPFSFFSKWGGPIVVLSTSGVDHHRKGVEEAVSLHLLEHVVKEAERKALADAEEAEKEEFLLKFSEFWSEEKDRVRGCSLGLDVYLQLMGSHIRRGVPATRKCYGCDKEVHWLAPDARCGKCTRLTQEEIAGKSEGH